MQHLLNLLIVLLHSLLLDDLHVFVDLSADEGSETLRESEEGSWLSPRSQLFQLFKVILIYVFKKIALRGLLPA